MPPNVPLQRAITDHQNGRLESAKQYYLTILQSDPDQVDALHLLGVIALQTGEPENAIHLIQQALTQKPDWSDARANLANAYNVLGVTLHREKRFDQAIAAYNQAIQIQPSYFEALSNLCLALSDGGKFDQAITAGKNAIALNPTNENSHHNLAIALERAGQLDPAIEHQRQAILLNPEPAQAQFSLGNLLISKGQLDEAILAFENAVAIKPDYAAAFNNLGNALIDTGQVKRATAAFEQATALKPNNTSYASAIVFSLLFDADSDARAIAERHFNFGSKFAPASRQTACEISRSAGRLRIGYFSPDFRDHPVARFLLPLLENHDRGKFEIFCYSAVVRPDAMTERLKSLANTWRDIATLNHDDAANLIRTDRVDILIDLAGHTSGGRLPIFARKPAPVQASYLGYPATTGLTAIDFRLTDHLVDPVGVTESLHTEKLHRLPHTNWCFTPPPNSPPIAPPPMLRNGYITFGSFNRFAKVTEQMLETWLRILQSVPHSRLVMKAAALVAQSARTRVQSAFNSQGVELSRLTLLGPQPDEPTYLTCTNQIDIALDTFPYHGTKTTCDMLWMGIPVITLAGQTHISRVGVSLLTNVGLADLIASTPGDYVMRCVDLAKQPTRLRSLRQSLRDTMLRSPLMDAVRFAQDVETALNDVWGTRNIKT